MQKLGVTLGEVPMVWFVLTLFTLMASYFGGLTAGWFGKRWTIILGWSIFALVYVGFAYSYTLSICWVLVAVYGVHLGLIESSERVIAASLVNSHQRASAMGWYYFAYGIGALPASLLFGFFWNHVSDKFAFLWNAGLTCVAIVLFLIWLNPRKGLHDLSA
ncbi:MAG: MFS transporter [Deltaproteobacteria bacterium]|nr:MAG: MFS transporter [Deltaproteobacteria bacterium]